MTTIQLWTLRNGRMVPVSLPFAKAVQSVDLDPPVRPHHRRACRGLSRALGPDLRRRSGGGAGDVRQNRTV